MKSSSSLLRSAFFFLFLVLFLQNSSFAAATVEETCRSVADFVDYTFCLTSLQTDPRSPSADRSGLALVSVELSLVNATSTKSTIDTLLKNATEPSIKTGLQACSLIYSQAIGALKSMADLVETKEFHAAKELNRVPINVGNFCQDALPAAKPGDSPPLVKENSDYSQLVLLSEVILGPLA
ncbi:putative invertase inhibitor [Typha angustifolia]|uniref:putative invertase inhibitor n=1 Tax=Typha angustifolia TaxID=59011 RepID=UPI003C2B50A3